jgi:hypothetical protein
VVGGYAIDVYAIEIINHMLIWLMKGVIVNE